MKKSFMFIVALLISASIMFVAGCLGINDTSVCQCVQCSCEDGCSCCCDTCHCPKCDVR